MKNKIVLFSNMKGGTGKTTLCELFATYAVEKELPVITFDADVQLSLYKDRQDDLVKNPSAETLWDVQPLVVDDTIESKIRMLKTVPGMVIIDCPGNVDNRNLQPLFRAADFIVVPFRYDRKNVRETKTFLDMLRQIGVSARCLFIPNMGKYIESKRQEFLQASNDAIKLFFGEHYENSILWEVCDRTDLRTANTIALTSKQRCLVKHTFDDLIYYIFL